MRASVFLFGLSGVALATVNLVSGLETGGYWYEKVKHNGMFSVANSKNYVVYRNAKDYGAKGDGTTDDSAAIQKAINTVEGSGSGSRVGGTTLTGQPAVVYFPPGTYLVNSGIKNIMGTVLMGDPTNRPVIKAGANFKDAVMLTGNDPKVGGLVSFFHEIKNLVLDSTAVPTSKSLALLQFSVSQACQLSNVMFNMPIGATGHVGIFTAGPLMPLLMNDLQFFGGSVGYVATALQCQFKNWYFKNVATGIKVSDTLIQATGQGFRFEDCTVGIDATSGGSGHFSLLDTTAANTSTLFSAAASTNQQGSLALENVIVDKSVAATVKIGGATVLTGSVEPGNTWIRGNTYMYSNNSSTTIPNHSNGAMFASSRPAALVNSTGFYHTVIPPTYEEYDASQVINVKDVSDHPVSGDGKADDTASLQAIINAAAGKNIVYFPYGTYILTDTLLVPPGSRLIGEAWTKLSARGSKFKDAKNPRAMIKVGNTGDVGVAQMTDFLFTISENVPGAVLVEVNMASDKPGDVGFFNNHFLVMGGTARLCAHFTSSASVYWENSWATGQGNSDSAPGAAGGFLVEALNGTWIVGLGSEHHVLYQLNINKAKTVFVGLEQGESPYWQGPKNTLLPPAPFTDSLLPSDPDFSWCAAGDPLCREALYQRVADSSDINLYGGGFWNFRAGPTQSLCTGECQTNAVLYERNSRLFSYGISTINSKNLVMESGPGGGIHSIAVTRDANIGNSLAGFALDVPAFMAAYFRQSH